MPGPDDTVGRPPDDFASLLALSEPVLLVGGQAVNLWAVYYESRTRDLAPFVSRDVDVLGNRETLEALARLAGTVPQLFPMTPPSNAIGVVLANDGQGRPLIIEVLRYVHGTSNKELRDPTYTFAVGETLVHVPGPIALLQAKLANVADLPQAGRQDIRHVRILSRLIPSYLADLRSAVESGGISERQLLDLLERVLEVVGTEKGRRVLGNLEIRPLDYFAELRGSKLRKLNAFLDKRVPRAFSR